MITDEILQKTPKDHFRSVWYVLFFVLFCFLLFFVFVFDFVCVFVFCCFLFVFRFF